MAMAYAKLEEQKKKNRMSHSRKARSVDEGETDLIKKCLYIFNKRNREFSLI